MPVLIAIVVLSAVAGLAVPRASVAYAIASCLAVLANVVFVWAVADGKGDDPAWILLVSLAAGVVAIAATRATITIRRSTFGNRASSI